MIGSVHTRIDPKKVAAFKAKVRQITRRTSPVHLEQVIQDLNSVLCGWGHYFRMANCKSQFGELAGWIRRRLRAKQLALWFERRVQPERGRIKTRKRNKSESYALGPQDNAHRFNDLSR